MSTLRMLGSWAGGAALLVALAVTPAATAQPGLGGGPPPGGPPPDSPEWAEMMERIRLVRMLRISEALQLDDETALQLSRYLKERDAERMEVMAARGEAGKRIKAFVDAGETDDETARQLLRDAIEAEEQMRTLEQELIEGLDGILTPTQQLKFVLVNRELDREIRDLVRQERRGGGSGPPGGPRGGPPGGPPGGE